MHKLRRGLFSLTMLIILLTGCNSICIAEESAEKGPAEIGDILYYSYGEDWWPGHAMLYVGWYPVREPKRKNLRVIESMPPSEELNPLGLVNESIDYTYDYARTWKEGLTAEQRRKISEFVISKTGLWRYCEDRDHTYQKGQDGIHCDCAGLCEAAYESIGLDPVPREGWILWPEEQCISSRMKPATPVPPKIRLEPSDEGTLKAYASDGDKGSGITRVEFWDGEPDDTPDDAPGVRLGYDDHDVTYSEGDDEHTYTIDYDGYIYHRLYAKAFDQAGNTKVNCSIEDTYIYSINPQDNFSTYHLLHASHLQFYWIEKPGEIEYIRHRYKYTYFKLPSPEYDHLHVHVFWAYHWFEDSPVTLNMYQVDPETYATQNVTWNDRPPDGPLIFTRDYSPSEFVALEGNWLILPVTGVEAFRLEVIQTDIVCPPDPSEKGCFLTMHAVDQNHPQVRPFLTRGPY